MNYLLSDSNCLEMYHWRYYIYSKPLMTHKDINLEMQLLWDWFANMTTRLTLAVGLPLSLKLVYCGMTNTIAPKHPLNQFMRVNSLNYRHSVCQRAVFGHRKEFEVDDPSELSPLWTHLSTSDVIWMEDMAVVVRSGEHSATVSTQSSGPLPVNPASEATDASRLVSILPLFSPSVLWQENKDGWVFFIIK